jgi:hypothetical protein
VSTCELSNHYRSDPVQVQSTPTYATAWCYISVRTMLADVWNVCTARDSERPHVLWNVTPNEINSSIRVSSATTTTLTMQSRQLHHHEIFNVGPSIAKRFAKCRYLIWKQRGQRTLSRDSMCPLISTRPWSIPWAANRS